MIDHTINTLANTHLTEHHVYRLGGLLLEASYRRGWTLMVLTEKGNHVPRSHGALVGFRMRDDGRWDSIHDKAARRFFGWTKWSVTYGEPRSIDLTKLVHFAASRFAVEEIQREREIDIKFREIMAAMEW